MTKKLFAIAASAAFLVPQTVEIIRPTEGWYWPFLDYPMYSWPQPEGTVYPDYEYRVLPCEPGGAPLTLGVDILGMQYFQLYRRLDQAALIKEGWHPDQVRWARGTLSQLALERAGEDVCTGEVWVQRHHMEDGVGHVASEWQLARSWDLHEALAEWTGAAGRVEP